MKMKSQSGNPDGMPLKNLIIVTVLMLILTFTFLYPLYYMLINSFKDSVDYYIDQFAFPSSFDMTNYKVMLVDFDIMRYFRNSLIISCSSTILVVFFATVASYAFAKINFRGKNIAYALILITMFLPSQVTIIPQYVMFSKYKLVNTYTSVILAYLSGGLPGAIMLLRSAFVGIPGDLLESAKIDGAGHMRTLFSVAIPVTMASISIQIIFCFLGNWNDLLTPLLLLSDYNKQTVMVALSTFFSRYGNAPTRQLTGILLSIIPTVVLYLFLQKYMMKGMLVGSIKA